MNASGAAPPAGSAKSAAPTSGAFFRPFGEEDEGLWFLRWADGRRRPYPSAQAAWDDWHADPPPPLWPHRTRDAGMSGDGNPGPVPGTETWIYGGIWAGQDGKRRHSWVDPAGEEH
jgi:hypothetical protein